MIVAAHFWLEKLPAPIRQDCGKLIASPPRDDPDKIARIWREQLTSLIEFSAAWNAMPNGAYKATRDSLTKALAARKNLRDFEPWTEMRGGVPKSSLDGARETVLLDNKQRPPKLVKKYRLGENEQLDAVGLIKRAGGTDPDDRKKEDEHDLQFVPIVNVALAPWIARAKQYRLEFEAAIEALKAIRPKWPRVKRRIACGSTLFNTDPDKPDDRVEGFDASIFLRSRWWPEFKELGIWQTSDERAWREKVVSWGNDNVGPLLKLMYEPHPYVACLVADGDGMGAAIDALGSAGEHRTFSGELATFALAAREIVERKDHLGSLVYSGGDDVLAFLPVSKALACADELRLKFEAIMERALSKPDGTLKDGVQKLPTLSVGIGIGHIMESMGDLLELGRRAEKLAKGGHLKRESKDGKRKDRDALAVILDKRSGGTCEWRAQWPEWEADGGPAGRLRADKELLGKRLSMRKVHQIGALLRRLPAPRGCSAQDAPDFDRVLVAELKRTLKRSEGDGDLTPEVVGLPLNGPAYSDNHKAVAGWIDRMLIARAFAESEPRARAAGTVAEAAA